ncbi:PepSY-associated TM helix domain-containing protein [Nostoc sp. PA-18-2419]|uniref:PepSY-associated TM helix domain-containing protein n=1 Tax=Nostoc sp. PA-18-2419 TaxID=2575443 RepID=UPI00110857F4|nr:PepSY-associated TM helix domain-containing protein [Nostoc sp. PA-18-2419]
MRSKKLRDFVFRLHRYIGLAVGLIAIIIGLTGSLLVFHDEISEFLLHRQIGTINHNGERLPVEVILNQVKTAYTNQPDVTIDRIYISAKPNAPAVVVPRKQDTDLAELYVNPYNGAIIGNSQKIFSERFFSVVYELHYSLLAGKTGYAIAGIAALLMCILSITGIVLWPGWRKLLNGFKIKLDAHPKRVNFDIHKVAGIVTAIFIALTGFTGFCWNFSDFTNPIIYAVTFTNKSASEPVSKLIPGKTPLELIDQLKTARATFPNAMLGTIYFPRKPQDALSIRFKLPQDDDENGQSYVYLDQYTGKVLRVDNILETPLGDRVLNSFEPLHYGTFGGLPTRILYVFVGLAPLILFITGFVMWWYRRKSTSKLLKEAIFIETLSKNAQK